VGLGAASIGWTGLARLVGGAVWAVSATLNPNVTAQHNSRRELDMELKVKTKALYLAEGYGFATRGNLSRLRRPPAEKNNNRVTFCAASAAVNP
jgi:hypothetical protein